MAVKTTKPLTANKAAPVNSFIYAVEQIIRDRMNVAIPVIVTDVEVPDDGKTGSSAPAGYVTVKPLVCTRDADDNTLEPTELFHVPYSRVQGGVVAIITDPVVGDIGLAVFAQLDSSNVVTGTTKPVQPGSFRYYDMADGFYIGGFLNQAPTCYLELKQDNTAVLHATGGVTIDGDVQINGDVTTSGKLTTAGDIKSGGDIDATGEISGDGHNLSTHVHGGVETGSGTTGTPEG